MTRLWAASPANMVYWGKWPSPFWVLSMTTSELTFSQYALGLICMMGEAYLITIGLVRRLVFNFLVFYLYITVLLLRDVLSFLIGHHAVSPYPVYNLYYRIEFVVYVLLFGIIFDIYRRVFKPFPAIRKFFQGLLLLCFVGLLALAMTKFPLGLRWWSMTMMEFGKNIRFAVALLLMSILGIIGYYKVPLNRNLGGLLFGMAFNNIAAVALAATFAFFGPSMTVAWQTLSVLVFLFAEVIWIASLSSVAAPVAMELSRIEGSTYATMIPDVADGLGRINARLSLWMGK